MKPKRALPDPKSRARRARPAVEPTLTQRSAGVLLHLTSLPGPYGAGDLGASAYAFVDFLARARLRWWQMLPTTPCGPGDCPYNSPSHFAGNPLLIDLDALIGADLLKRRDVAPLPNKSRDRAAFGATIRLRTQALRCAYDRFAASRAAKSAAYRRFREENASWLPDYSLFRALQDAHGEDWSRWPRDLRRPSDTTRQMAGAEYAEAVGYETFLQFEYDRQWRRLRDYARSRDVWLIGDLPIFGAHASADVWANPDLFELDARGRPTALTGYPPDYFNREGQFWGHPQYRWSAHVRSGFSWWIARFAHLLRAFDAVRIDHFLGFQRVWRIPAGASSAREGRWRSTPGDELFTALRRRLGACNIIAEDLGLVTPKAIALREKHGFPGMRVMVMGFGDDSGRFHLPFSYEHNTVAYTGTHDMETVHGWFSRVRRAARSNVGDRRELARARAFLGGADRDVHWQMIRSLMGSVANTVIVPMQDILGLGTRARMNIPGTPTGNWRWRMRPGAANNELADRLAQLVDATARDGT